MRYYERLTQDTYHALGVAAYYQTTEVFGVLKFSVKRAQPSMSASSSGAIQAFSTGTSRVSSAITFSQNSLRSSRIKSITSAASATGVSAWIELDSASDYIEIDAEL